MSKGDIMEVNELAKYMRDRALLIEGDEHLDDQSLRKFRQVAEAKAKKKKQVEAVKKLYFDAGRWVGGARDYTARMAYLELVAREKAIK
jgi:hypothetical protein